MTNTPGTSTPKKPNAKGTQPETDQTPRAVIVGQTVSRGFSGPVNHEQQRYHDIFDDTQDTRLGGDSSYQAMGLGGVIEDQQSNFRQRFSFGPGLDGDTFLFLHHRKGQGVQIIVQAGTRVFVISVVILVLLVSSPGIRDTLDWVVKTILNLK